MGAKAGKLLQIRCDDEFLELLDRRAGECGLDRTGYIKLVVTKSEVRVERGGGAESKASIERDIKKESIRAVPAVVAELQAKVDGIKGGEYKQGDVFVKNEASDYYGRLRRATVAFCFQNDIADESLLNKAQKEFIEKNVPFLLGEVKEEAEETGENVPVIPKTESEFKQIWLNEHGAKDLGMHHASKFKTKKEKKGGKK
jgi:hypothetical protein